MIRWRIPFFPLWKRQAVKKFQPGEGKASPGHGSLRQFPRASIFSQLQGEEGGFYSSSKDLNVAKKDMKNITPTLPSPVKGEEIYFSFPHVYPLPSRERVG